MTIMTDSSHDKYIFGNPLEDYDDQVEREEEDDHDASEDDTGSDSETKDVQKGNYDDDEVDDNDDNYDNANPWVELTDQVQESLSELFDEQVQLYRQQGKSDIVLSFLGVNSIVPALWLVIQYGSPLNYCRTQFSFLFLSSRLPAANCRSPR